MSTDESLQNLMVSFHDIPGRYSVHQPAHRGLGRTGTTGFVDPAVRRTEHQFITQSVTTIGVLVSRYDSKH